LRTLAYRLLEDRTAMDDVMQDAYLKAFQGFPAFRGEAQARTWVYRIVYNACIDRLRSDKLRPSVALEAADDCGPSHPDPADSIARNRDLTAALAGLPADERATVLLVDAAGLDYKEAAAVLGVRPGTIGSRLHHARSVLRASLDEGEQ
jgi:RNA polymerase sigma-70 factor, ECF subfamily